MTRKKKNVDSEDVKSFQGGILTSVVIPLELRTELKQKGITLKHCIITGYNTIKKGDEVKKTMEDLNIKLFQYENKIGVLTGRLSQLSQAMYSQGMDPMALYTEEQQQKIRNVLKVKK